MTRLRPYLLPLAFFLALTLPHLGQGDLRTDTGWYSAIGLSSVRHLPHATSIADALTLHAEPGKPFFNKPPLALWIHGVVLHVFGVSVAAARLPTIAAGAACVLLVVAIVRSVASRSQAMMTGVALACTLEFARRTKELSLDMWQLVFMLAAVLIVVRTDRIASRPGWRNALASGACIGAALLCKPLMALLVSLLLVAWLASRRRLAPAWTPAHLLAALGVAAPWYAVMTLHHGDAFLARHFVGEVADRAAGLTTAGPGGHLGGGAEPPTFYLSQILSTYWPWLATTLLAVVALARRELTPRARPLAAFAILWFLAWLLLLTIFPDRRPRYALVLWPAGAILSGLWLGVPAARALRPVVRALAAWGFPVAAVGGIAFALAPVRLQRPPAPQWPALFAWLHETGTADLYQGAAGGPTGARIYLQTGRWPIPTQDRQKHITSPPPAGAALLYHRRDGYAPGPGEAVIFHEGDLTVTRLERDTWTPVPTPDPGEEEP
jgi:4-amino-4-deoxy-L-arabinose transferase-like glycosyltransferase